MKKILTDKQGNVLAYVMIVMLMVFIVIGAVVSLAQSNIRQASAQEKGMQAYYLARSGAELAFEAILDPDCDVLTNFKNGSLTEKTESVTFDNGTADVKVTKFLSGETPKIMIESLGTLDGSGISRTVKLEFNVDYTTSMGIVWSD